MQNAKNGGGLNDSFSLWRQANDNNWNLRDFIAPAMCSHDDVRRTTSSIWCAKYCPRSKAITFFNPMHKDWRCWISTIFRKVIDIVFVACVSIISHRLCVFVVRLFIGAHHWRMHVSHIPLGYRKKRKKTVNWIMIKYSIFCSSTQMMFALMFGTVPRFH